VPLPRLGLPDLGIGVGLRPKLQAELFAAPASVDFVEVISENYMVAGGRPLASLERARSLWPVLPHGVSLGIGSEAPPEAGYLEALSSLVRRLDPPWVTDHLCFTRAGGVDLHELLPLPPTRKTLQRVVDRARELQDRLGRRLALENTSTYLEYRAGELPEWEFVAEVAERADIGLLLDVNNVYVSSVNHGFDPHAYLAAIPADRVVQIHLAGHTDRDTHLLDTHDGPVAPPVWPLYEAVIERVGPVSTLLEWDDDIPPLARVTEELALCRAARERALARRGRSGVAAE